MSAKATAYVWENSPYTGTQRLIHLAIADIANDENDNMLWCRQDTIAQKVLCDRKTVTRTLHKMVDDGYLRLVRPAYFNAKEQRGTTNTYEFLMPGTPKGQSIPPEGHLIPTGGTSHPVEGTKCPTNSIELNSTTKEELLLDFPGKIVSEETTPEPTPSKAAVPPAHSDLPRNGKNTLYPEDFDDLFKRYPTKRHTKNKAYMAWRARLNQGFTREELARAVDNYATAVKRDRTEDKYVAWMSTFFADGGPWTKYDRLETNWKDPRQNIVTDRSGKTGEIVIESLADIRARREQNG